MAILLPALPRSAEVEGEIPDASARVTPTTGAGAAQTILRPGRFAVSVTIGDLSEAGAAAWLAAQLRHKTEGAAVRLVWPRYGVTGLPAGAVADGSGQAGSVLAIRGLTPGLPLPTFTPFSFIKNGVVYMHRTTTEVVADGAGKVIVTIGPMLRASPTDGTALAFTEPMIEGDLDPGPVKWTVKRLRFNTVSFKITER
ncbi:hypothetical protein [Caulobacter vibrioides]|uniref:hypothetical protein n=1 Tax=Caulobacter vibrioides TaxID=155892 RepID=UPI000BB525CF|nr:hypothetical protein [Caulobacter vibrioides]ATC26501.1 hypothetical protein CA608_19190 [Caulobacter vibrioides]PLR12323.1 hypothetical protein CVUC_08820 [Caulobacter vibrioides]